jgi:hypothetical protein
MKGYSISLNRLFAIVALIIRRGSPPGEAGA